jgi:hypothetical protein
VLFAVISSLLVVRLDVDEYEAILCNALDGGPLDKDGGRILLSK